MADITLTGVEVRYVDSDTDGSTDKWGPYLFRFPCASSETANDGTIPFGDTLSAVTVRAFIGNVKPKSDISDFTEITNLLIDPEYTPVVLANSVSIRLQHPGVDNRNVKATLIFELTLSSGAQHPFYAQYVKIR